MPDPSTSDPHPSPSTQSRIRARCQALADFLVAKNQAYGDSALRPIGLFARGRASDLIRVRIDDKLNRIRNRPDAFGEDAVQDLIGYLLLLQIAMDMEREEQGEPDDHPDAQVCQQLNTKEAK